MEQKAFPNHIAFIMDGNGRWATQRLLPRYAGHKAGCDAFIKIIHYAADIGLKYATFYAFSTENWSRSAEEVGQLMKLFEAYFGNMFDDILQGNAKIRFIGDRSALSPNIRDIMARVEKASEKKTGLVINFGMNYGGKSEITMAARSLAADVAAGRVAENDIDEAKFSQYLYTAGQPDVDLLIRTGGDMRVSNFLLWQSAYAELLVLDKYWPDFGPDDLDAAIESYRGRDRRFGGVKG